MEGALPVSVANGEDVGSLLRAVQMLDKIPRGCLDLAALTRVQLVTMSETHPYRGMVRDTAMVIKLHGKLHKDLPPPGDAREMAREALRSLDAKVAMDRWHDHVIEVAADIHARITQAHPFADGNGRVARALSAWVLVKAGYRIRANPRTFCIERIEDYYRALSERDMSAAASCDHWSAFFEEMVATCFDGPTIGPRRPRRRQRVRAIRRRLEVPTNPAPDCTRVPEGIVVELTHRIPDARIYYTIDGSDPTRMSTPYRGEFLLTFPAGHPVTVKAIAAIREHADSVAVGHVYFPPSRAR